MPDEAQIRRADPADAPSVAAVLNGVIAEGRLTVFDRPIAAAEEAAFIASLGPRSALHVAVWHDVVVGVQSLDVWSAGTSSMAHVATMGTWLRTDARGRGVGRALARESFRFAVGHGYTKVFIQVLETNERALRFYQALGFERVGVARRHVKLRDRLHDEVYLERFLDLDEP